jgi:predicted metal-dependent hydrolase
MKMNHIKLFWSFSEKLKSQARQKKYRIISKAEVQHRWSFIRGRKKGFFL